jgi:hypothetical protein
LQLLVSGPFQQCLVSRHVNLTGSSTEARHGLGIPVAELSEHNVEHQLFVRKRPLPPSNHMEQVTNEPQPQWLWLSVPFYNLTMVLTKFSALTLYARIFRPHSFLLVTYILMGFLVIVGLWTTLSGFFFCIPVHAFWSPSAEIRRTKCLPATPVWFTNAAIQTSTDLVILILPLPLLWKLQLPKREKWGILIVFSLGIM